MSIEVYATGYGRRYYTLISVIQEKNYVLITFDKDAVPSKWKHCNLALDKGHGCRTVVV